MGRFLVVALVLGFVAQQFACCGMGICTAVCGGEFPINQACQTAKKSSCPCHHGHGDQHADGRHRRDLIGGWKPPLRKTGDQRTDGVPGRDGQHPHSPWKAPHQHHVCVGTHLFYVSAYRFDLADLMINAGIECSPFDPGLNFLTSNSILISACQHCIVLPSVVTPQRSALCVYRI